MKTISNDINDLVMQQRLDALTCYICDRGSDGCGPSLLTTGRGVVTTSSSINPTCCTVSI
jgi:hypothetical protein